MYSNIEEWADELGERIWENSAMDSEKLLSVLLEIFQKIPSEDAETLLQERDVCFILPIITTAKEFRHTFHESALENDGYGTKINWLVMLRSDLIDGNRDNLVYVVAHELAHVLLDHNSGIKESGPQCEIEADQLVIKWGFEKELKASPDNYLYGDGEWQKKIRESVEKGIKAKEE